MQMLSPVFAGVRQPIITRPQAPARFGAAAVGEVPIKALKNLEEVQEDVSQGIGNLKEVYASSGLIIGSRGATMDETGQLERNLRQSFYASAAELGRFSYGATTAQKL